MKRSDLLTLDEDVVGGSVAYCYHRSWTRVVDYILEKGWKPGAGALYGVGLYTCWKVQDQLDGKMAHKYGDGAIIKFRMDLAKSRFLYFDYDLAKIVHGEKYSIVDQLVALKIYRADTIPEFWNKIHEWLDDKDPRGNSAVIALKAFYFGCNEAQWGSFNQFAVGTGVDFKQNSVAGLRNVIQKWNIDGIAYEGEQDNKVLLVYDYLSAIPVAWAIDDTSMEAGDGERTGTGRKLVPLPSTGKIWNSILNKRDLTTAQTIKAIRTSDAYPKGAIKRIINTVGWSDQGSELLERMRREFPWSVSPKAHFMDASIEITREGLNFISGTWLSGEFKGLSFGTKQGYESGGGADQGALFKAWKINMRDRMSPFYGVFPSGVFERGRFMGCFRGGIVNLDNTLWDDSMANFDGSKSSLGTTSAKVISFRGRSTRVFHGVTSLEEFVNLPEAQGFFNGLEFIDKNGKARFVESDGKIGYREKLVEEERTGKLFEDMFKIRGLSPEEQDKIFDAFTKSYIDATGASFGRNDFQWRAEGWEFYGSLEGGVAIRRQNSGGLKITASYGEVNEVIKGFRELISKNPGKVIWGVMPLDLCKGLEFLTRSTGDFKRLPGVLVKTVFPYLAPALGIKHAGTVGMDGGITIDTPAGPMKKFLTGNQAYRSFLKDAIENEDSSKLPVPNLVIGALKGMAGLLL